MTSIIDKKEYTFYAVYDGVAIQYKFKNQGHYDFYKLAI